MDNKWEYRVFRMPNGTYGLFEWDEEHGRNESPVQDTYFESLEELKRDIEAMLQACNNKICDDEPE